MLVVQVIEILWSKATRGAPMASVRAKLPRAFAIELFDAPYVLHHVRMAEWEEFSPRLIQREGRESIPSSEGGLSIHSEDHSSFRLGLVGNPCGGKPHRHPANQVLRLLPGEFARLLINGRHTSNSGGQWYSEYVYNVASGVQVPANRFLLGKPEHEFSLAANLF